MTELCELYGIARKTGHKFVDRYLKEGPEGLEERSRRPENYPNQTPEHIVQAILELRQRHPSWGAKKLLAVLEKRHPRWDSARAQHGVRHSQPPWHGAEEA